MSRLDLVIFGATGFTGKHTVKHMVEFAKKYEINSWGVAARSEKKLHEVMNEIAQQTGVPFTNVKPIIASIDHENSLREMCAQAKVVVNCAGPYRLYGEPVVKAAIDSKTHYVDVSGEPQFMEQMQLRYHDLARQAGVFVISACGWDSIPADMGVVFLQQNFGGTLNSVRSYLDMHIPGEAMAQAAGRGVINYGTWASLVHGVANMHELRPLRRKLYMDPLPKLTPKIHRQTLHKKQGKGGYYLPFLGSDESVVYRTQRHLHSHENIRPAQFKAYVRVGDLISAFFALFGAILFFLLAKVKITRRLLLNHPRIFSLGKVSRKGPTDVVMNNTFFSFELIGEGWENGADIEKTKPNKQLTVKVCGVNPGYGATCVALLCAALTIIQERDRMPATGGVMTTGAAFRGTSLLHRLCDHGLKYEICK